MSADDRFSDDLYAAAEPADSNRVLSVSELTGQIKGALEGRFSGVWVSGEISNFSRPQSGHCYLTLKDDGAQIRAVASTDSGRQVLCVTHLPQIAAYADHHFHVEKTELAGRTETHVRKLTGTARKDELARMLGGQATSKAKAHAAELLSEAARSDARSDVKKPRARA